MRAQFVSTKVINTRFAIMIAKNANANRSNAVLKTEVDIKDYVENTVSLDISTLESGTWYVYAGINTGGSGWNDKRIVNVMEVGFA